jgi:hypothetical protein
MHQSIKAGAIITVHHKRKPDLTFDNDYLQNTHIPLAAKFWEPRGLLEAYSSFPTEDSEYAYTLTMFWKSLQAWEEATKVQEEMALIIADVAKFTNGEAVFVVGKVVG